MSPVAKSTIARNQKGADALSHAVSRIKREHDLIDKEDRPVVDIITFCDSPKYLYLPGPEKIGRAHV